MLEAVPLSRRARRTPAGPRRPARTAATAAAATLLLAAVPGPPVVVPAAPSVAGIEIAPAVQRAAVAGPPVVVRVDVANGGDVAVTLALAAEVLVAGPEGRPEAGPADGVVLPADVVGLDPGEAAQVELGVDADLAPAVLRITAATNDTEPARSVSALAVIEREGAPAPHVEADLTLQAVDDRSEGSVDDGLAVTATLATDRPTVVTARLRVRTLGGELTDQTVGPLAVLPGRGRSLVTAVDPGGWPTPVWAELAAVDLDGGVVSASTRVVTAGHRWLLAGLLLAVTALVAGAATWRRRTTRRDTG